MKEGVCGAAFSINVKLRNVWLAPAPSFKVYSQRHRVYKEPHMSLQMIEQALMSEGVKDPGINDQITTFLIAAYAACGHTPRGDLHGLSFLENQNAAMLAIPPGWGIQKIEGSQYREWSWLVTLSTQSLHRDENVVRSYGKDGTEPAWLWGKPPAVALTLAGLRAWAIILVQTRPEMLATTIS
jgi:hypothetical protein